MTSPPRILVVLHRYGNLDDPCNYMIREVAQVWREDGYSVEFAFGPMPQRDADIVLNHIDLTVVPVDHLACLRLYPRVLNGAVVDISKRMISENLVACSDDWDGPVIAKANLNAAGLKEAELAVRGLYPAPYARVFDRYEILPNKARVPDDYWRSQGIVVEKFLPEKDGDLYCLRTWVFLGDRESNSLSYSEEPIVKQRTVIKRVVVDEVPDDLRALRADLGFDYGKFDYAIVDGRVVLYDANRTPSLGTFSREDFMPRVRHYAKGIEAFL